MNRPPVRRLDATRTTHRLPGSVHASLRTVLGRFATGVTVITTGGEHAHGMTANAFSSVSLEPPLVMLCISKGARLYHSIMQSGSFGVSILAAGQEDVSRHFADWRRPDGMAQFAHADHRIGTHTGSPLIAGALAWLECEVVDAFAGGDHSIFVGKVLGCDLDSGSGALSFFAGGYHVVGTTDRKAS